MNRTSSILVAAISVALIFTFSSCDDDPKKALIGQWETDSRDGKKYKTVKIGKQVWLAENLNFELGDSKCYDNNPENCEKYGRLYNWKDANVACPKGWRLPSNADWDVLYAHAEGNAANCVNNDGYNGHCPTAGTKLKAVSGWNTGSGYIAGTDAFGFSALPGGGGIGSSFNYAGDGGYWWSASEYSSSSIAYSRYMNYNDEDAYWGNGSKDVLFSVRCLKD